MTAGKAPEMQDDAPVPLPLRVPRALWTRITAVVATLAALVLAHPALAQPSATPPAAPPAAPSAALPAALPAAPPASPAPPAIRVLLPDPDNLQYLAFWVARGAGYFDAEGVPLELVVADQPIQVSARMVAGAAPVAVLPPPVYLQLIADRYPLRLVANLLRNDPIDLVVRRSVFEQRHMDAKAPLRDRLLSLHGLRVGVAPGPPARLRALFASVGLDADRELTLVIRRGPDQNDAFARDECDALYAHTPYLEKALDDEDAVMLVNQSAGEVPALAMRQIHALVVHRDFLAAQPGAVEALVRAIARAETLVRTDAAATEDAVMRALPSLDRRHVRTLLGLYRAAVPAVPDVSVEGLAPALALFPASRRAPSLDGIPLAEFVAEHVRAARATAATAAEPLAPSMPASGRRGPDRGLAVALALAVFGAVGLGLFVAARLVRRARCARRARSARGPTRRP